MFVFENMHQNKGLTALKITSKQNPIGTGTSRIIHDTPLITKKNPRPSKGRVPSYNPMDLGVYFQTNPYFDEIRFFPKR